MKLHAIAAGQRVRWLRLRRRLQAEAARGQGRLVGLAGLGVGLALVVFGACFGGGYYVVWRHAPELLLTGTSTGLTGLAAALVFSSLGHAAQSFFQSQDLWMWDSAPTGAAARFVDRCTETAFAALPPTLALGSTALGGFALGGGLGLAGALRAVVAVVVVVPLPLAVGVGLAHVGGAMLPAGRLRRISLLLLGIGVTAALVWFRRARVERLLTEEGANQLLSAAKDSGAIGPSFLPSRQLALFVVDADGFAFCAGAGVVALVVAAAFAAHVFLYDRARKLAVDESPTGVLRGSMAERFWRGATALAPRDLQPMLRKDLLAFVRDPGQWGQVVLLAGVGVLYLVNASALGDGLRGLGAFGGVVLVAMHTGIVGFVAGGLAARFAFPQVGLEGPAIWIIDGAPLAPRRLLLAKWLAACPVVVGFPALLAVGGALVLDFGWLRVLWSTGLIVALALGIAGLAVFRGALQPLFDAASLSELAMGPGAVSTMVLSTSLAFAGATCAFLGGGLYYAVKLDFVDRAFALAAPVLPLLPLLVVVHLARGTFHQAARALLSRRSDFDGGAPASRDQRSISALD